MVAWAIFTVLQMIAAIHILWAFGVYWPARSGKELSAMVAGVQNPDTMPPTALTVVVAGCFSAMGIAALWEAGMIDLPWIAVLQGKIAVLLTVIFIGRGVLTYLPIGPLTKACEPFRTYDRRAFAPLSLCLGLGFLWLALNAS